jgi:hypothetical protein
LISRTGSLLRQRQEREGEEKSEAWVMRRELEEAFDRRGQARNGVHYRHFKKSYSQKRTETSQ